MARAVHHLAQRPAYSTAGSCQRRDWPPGLRLADTTALVLPSLGTAISAISSVPLCCCPRRALAQGGDIAPKSSWPAGMYPCFCEMLFGLFPPAFCFSSILGGFFPPWEPHSPSLTSLLSQPLFPAPFGCHSRHPTPV